MSFVENSGTFTATRDHFGVQPFYYARTARGLVWSDSLETVIAHPEVNAEELDDEAVADYLESGISDDEAATIYKHVRRLPPAHTLTFRNGELTIRRYWELPKPEPRKDAPARLEAALKQAIAERINEETAVVFMSGGLDSTTLAALAREVRPQTKLLASTTVYRKRIADEEEPFAVEAARSIGIPIDCFPLDDYPPLGALEAGLWTPDPGPLLFAQMTRDLYARVARQAKVAMHGHPADAVLDADLHAYLRGLSLPKRIAAMITYTRVRRRLPYFALRRPRPTAAIHPLQSPIWSSYFEWMHPERTGAPVEVVYPWCDVRVVEAAMGLAPIPHLVEKQVLRELLRGRVSETIRTRRKSFLRGNPWTAPLPPDGVRIDKAARYVDAKRFAETCRAAGFLDDAALRVLALDYWLRELPANLARLRMARRQD
jgi:asparagine synthase (glutamine-hydrolysing)